MSPPDFDQVARRLIAVIDPDSVEEDAHPIDDLHRQAIANQLAAVVKEVRQVWNARGAADLTQVATACDAASETGYRSLQELDAAIRRLDA